jgi:hypothetical protein
MDQSSGKLNGDFSPVDRNESETVGQGDQLLPAQQGQRPRKKALILIGQPGTGEDNVGRNFVRAAKVRWAELSDLGYAPIPVYVKNVDDVINALATYGQYEKIARIEYFGHSSPEALYIGQGKGPRTNLKASHLSELSNENLTAGCVIRLNSCSAGKNPGNHDVPIAAKIAKQLGRKVEAFDGPAIFSTNPDRPDGLDRPPEGVDIYLVPENGFKRLTFEPRAQARSSAHQR